MCRKAGRHDRIRPRTPGAYQEPAVPFDMVGGPRGERGAMRWQHFPWWSLWLIWPLIAALKWFPPLYLAALAEVRSNVGALDRPIAALAAVLLIFAGLLLIRRG